VVVYSNNQTRFPEATSVSVGGKPVDVTGADFDRDGVLDLAVAERFKSRVVLLRGGGGLQYEVSQESFVPEGLKAVAAGDLDGDGAPDLAAVGLGGRAASFSETSVLLNRGDGRMHPPVHYLGGGFSLSLGDIDGDGDLDLVSATVIFLNRGNGTFDDAVTVPAPHATFHSGLGDFDDDGDADLAALDARSDTVFLFANLGGGRFSPRGGFLTSRHPAFLEIAELDQRPGIDLAIVHETSPNLTIVFGREAISIDCNESGLPDPCDIAEGASLDLDSNGAPDECQPDCNRNGRPDGLDIAEGLSRDCNGTGIPDECEIANGSSKDQNVNSVPDECEPDCNRNGVPDDLDLRDGRSRDCNSTSVPDECEIASGTSLDRNRNQTPDECEPDCNGNSVPDAHDLTTGTSRDCNANATPDECDLASGVLRDRNANSIPDECEPRPRFHRGDPNGDGEIDVSDGLCTLAFLFVGGVRVSCLESLDANGDGTVDCSDAVFVLGFLFLGTMAPPDPGPPSRPCGPDPDAIGDPGDLGCESYSACPKEA